MCLCGVCSRVVVLGLYVGLSWYPDVLGMSVVRGMRGVGGVCEIDMGLARGDVAGEEGEWIRGLGLGFTIMWQQGECCTCVCVCVAV